jgi:hypothetical protein
VFVGKTSVLLVRLLLLVPGPLPRVLDGEGGDDDEHLAKDAVAVGLEHHASQARVQGQLGDLAAVCRESLARVGILLGRRVDRL